MIRLFHYLKGIKHQHIPEMCNDMSGQSCMIYLSTGSQAVQVKRVVLVHSTTLFIPCGVVVLRCCLLYEGRVGKYYGCCSVHFLLYQVYPLFVPSVRAPFYLWMDRVGVLSQVMGTLEPRELFH